MLDARKPEIPNLPRRLRFPLPLPPLQRTQFGSLAYLQKTHSRLWDGFHLVVMGHLI